MATSSKIIYFDNGCRVCRTGALLASKSGFSEQETLNPLQEMEEGAACDMEKARYCNEVAVYDPATKESRYGVKGILWVLEDKIGKIVRVFLFPPLYILINFFYHIFSYNRRMIAPAYVKMDNDCKPEFHWGFRLVYIVMAGLFSAFISYWMGSSLKEYFTSGYEYLLLVGAGWLIHAAMILVYRVKDKMEYYGNLASIMLAGILMQVPFLFCFHFFGINYNWLYVSLVLSDILMTYMSYRRVKYLDLSQGITFAWWLTLHASAALIFMLCH